MNWLAEHATFLAAFVSLITVLGSLIKFMMTRASDAKNREFEAYHRLIKEIVQPSENGETYVDRQCAAVFELRRFKHYRSLTFRILTGVQNDWIQQQCLHPRLATELELTLAHLQK